MKQYPVNHSLYDNAMAGELVADVVVEDSIAVELKVVRPMLASHQVQCVHSLGTVA